MQTQSKSQTELQQDTMQESVNTSMNEVESARYNVYMNYNKVDKINPNIATTLCARDYKGFGTGFNTMNGVIEVKVMNKINITNLSEEEVKLILRGLDRLFDTSIREEEENSTSELYKKISNETGVIECQKIDS